MESAEYSFRGACFDLAHERDRQVLGFVLSQALYGEATGVYCGRSLYAAVSLEAAQFYVRQAKQELNHLQLFADIFRTLSLTPVPPHWVIKVLAAHNDYYPLKVLMEHALGEGMVLDIFRDVLIGTLPDSDPRVPQIKKKLRVICREEREHVAWGEKETRRILAERPGLARPFYGVVLMQLALVPLVVRGLTRLSEGHPVLVQLPDFVAHVQARVLRQAQSLGIVPDGPASRAQKALAVASGVALLLRSKLACSRSTLDHRYLEELGFHSAS
jgi:hypothetical protein